jgi:hypothetical protein
VSAVPAEDGSVAASDGSHPIQLTHFETGRLFKVHWALDGRRILFRYGQEASDVVLIRNFR